jgi:hypothetical protein
VYRERLCRNAWGLQRILDGLWGQDPTNHPRFALVAGRRPNGQRYYAAGTLDRLGDAQRAAGDAAAAGDAWRRALEILSALDHPDADDVRAKLAGL